MCSTRFTFYILLLQLIPPRMCSTRFIFYLRLISFFLLILTCAQQGLHFIFYFYNLFLLMKILKPSPDLILLAYIDMCSTRFTFYVLPCLKFLPASSFVGLKNNSSPIVMYTLGRMYSNRFYILKFIFLDPIDTTTPLFIVKQVRLYTNKEFII